MGIHKVKGGIQTKYKQNLKEYNIRNLFLHLLGVFLVVWGWGSVFLWGELVDVLLWVFCLGFWGMLGKGGFGAATCCKKRGSHPSENLQP